jgi:hypothetical protein
MNWGEGLRRLATGVTWLFWAIWSLAAALAWWSGMKTWNPATSHYYWDWANIGKAYKEAIPLSIGFAVTYVVFTVLWRGGRWVLTGFKNTASPAE